MDFSETYLMTIAENITSGPPNLKIFWGRIPQDPPTRLLPSALAITPPRYRNLATALHSTTSFCKNVVVAETTYQKLARGFFISFVIMRGLNFPQ